MKTNTRLWFHVHSFTGIVTGLMLFLICWTGTFAVLSYEFDWLVTPELRDSQSGSENINWGKIWESAHQEDFGEIIFITAPVYVGTHAVAITKAENRGGQLRLIAPDTGELVGSISAYNLQRFFRDIHRRIFYPMPWGLYLIGIFAITLSVSLVAALVFYKKWWRRFFQFRAHNLRSFLSSCHKTLGLWSIWFIVIIAITSIWYVFESARYEFADGIINFTGTNESAIHDISENRPSHKLDDFDIDKTFDEIKTLSPDLDIKLVQERAENLIYVDGQTDWPVVRNRANQLYYDPVAQKAVHQHHAGDLPLYWLWSDMADPLHFGDFAGLTSKLIWFVFGLILSGIILTGTYLHAKRLKQNSHKQRYGWSVTHFATLSTILIWLGGIPFALKTAKQFYGDQINGVSTYPDLEPGVLAFILGWVGFTIMIVYAWHRMLSKR